MFEQYGDYGFTFYISKEGKIYVSNINEMINIHGLKLVDDVLAECDSYNSRLDEAAKLFKRVQNNAWKTIRENERTKKDGPLR